ncbi:hypothetical protein RUM43_004023 [Polyplax serrata]|uniref:Uncharacterized protein n=1 Tax=Polyplax serrata TaxID=468196 RepID=A0AAN8XMJ4_POLSC
MRIAIFFLMCLIVVNTVYCTRKSKASTSKGRGGNSRIKRADTQLQKPKTGDGIGLSRKKRSVPPDVPFSKVPKSTHGKSEAGTSKGRGGNSRVKRAATELKKPKSGAGIPVGRKKRSAPGGVALSDVTESTGGKSKASTSKGRGGNSRVKRAATELPIPETGDGIGLSRKKRSVPPEEPFSELAQTSDGSNTQKENNGKTENKEKMKPRIEISGTVKMRDTTN